MFLGKYLVNQDKVSEENLVEALCMQIESTPSLLRLAIENEILTSVEAIELVDKAIQKGQHFYDLLLEEKSDKLEAVKQLIVLQTEKRKGLGELLVGNGGISLDEYEKVLSDYFINKPEYDSRSKEAAQEEAKAENKEKKAESSSSSQDEDVAISSVALEALKELEGVGNADEISALESQVKTADKSVETQSADKGKDNQFVKSFSQEKYDEMRGISKTFADSKNVEILDKFDRFYHTLLGICRFENMNLLERFLSDLEGNISKAKKNWEKENVESASVEGFSNSIELLWRMRTAIYETGREVEAFSRAELKSDYLKLTKNLTKVFGL